MPTIPGRHFRSCGRGFHRYTVDPTWTVPHFEKMLYYNGQIMEYLAQLWGAGVQEPAFERAIAKTVEWLKREMIAPEGYFYAAQDADNFVTPQDVEPEEGDFYVWSHADLCQWLSPEALAELESHFTVTSEGNAEQALTAFLPVLTQAPRACPGLFSALDWYTHPISVKVQKMSPELIQALTSGYFSTTVFKQSSELSEGAIGLVCRDTTCDEPATTVDQLLGQITFSNRPS